MRPCAPAPTNFFNIMILCVSIKDMVLFYPLCNGYLSNRKHRVAYTGLRTSLHGGGQEAGRRACLSPYLAAKRERLVRLGMRYELLSASRYGNTRILRHVEMNGQNHAR